MAPSSSIPRPVQQPPKLPIGLTSIHDIHEGRRPIYSLASVVGMVRDCRLPICSRGADYKMTITLFDLSTEEYGQAGLDFVIFRPLEDMPKVNVADIVLVYNAKVQRFRSDPMSLISHRDTAIRVFSAAKIPPPPQSAEGALASLIGSKAKKTSTKEYEYVSWLYAKMDKSDLPEPAAFEVIKASSLNVKNKFSLLEDVGEGRFYDLICQVVREPYDLQGMVCLWVTDYTENSAFFNHAWSDGAAEAVAGSDGGLDGERDGDPYGYTDKHIRNSKGNDAAAWPGPYGKRCLQMSCWEPHADYIRSNVVAGDWVSLWNVQIKYGRNSANLEGFLREDRQAVDKVLIEVLNPLGEPENVDPRLKEALKRKLNYERQRKDEMKKLRAATASEGNKKRRGAEDAEKGNSKARRKAKRARKTEEIEEKEAQEQEKLKLNPLIICENEDKQVQLLSTLLEPAYYPTKTSDGQDVRLRLPFTNLKARAHVRVVNFLPHRLEDFAVSRRQSEFDVLSDPGSELDSESESESESEEDSEPDGTQDSAASPSALHRGNRPRRVWEWRFALELEDASPRAPSPPARLWALVDNTAGQLLTGHDAGDLRRSQERLVLLRETLFQLWGELEEKKSAQLAAAERREREEEEARERAEEQRAREAALRRKRLAGEVCPADSSDVEEDKPGPRDTAAVATGQDTANGSTTAAAKDERPASSQVSNQPFACCLQQYGVAVPAENEAEADAGPGRKWLRVFSLFGTKIASPAG